MIKYAAITILIFSQLLVNGQKFKWLNKLSYNSTIEPGKAIIYGNFIQRLGFSSGGFTQDIQIINLGTEERFCFTVKPALKSAKENTFIYFIKPGNYAILHYWWPQCKWYGGKIFTEPIYKGIASKTDLDEKIKLGQVSRDELRHFTFSVTENSLTYLGTWHFDKEVVSFTNEQLITYTPFLKTASITEGANQLSFMYGPDYERVKTSLNENQLNTNTETRIFVGNYEKQIRNGITREIHYIDGGNGLCAIVIKENGIFTPYAVYTDHLGSITTVTNTLGDIIAEQNFDAWGRERYPNNWNIYAASSKPEWLYRGYTGHEMLPYFNLINMNGRMYDPIVGRMCSPDNYVANTNGTQGYNRYSYANNNPLVYTDPDGNFVLAVIAIFTAVHVTADLIRNDFKINFGQYLGSFFRGALSGFLASTGAGAITSASSAFVAAAASELPGVSIPISDHFSLGLSPAIAYGSGGWSYGGSLSLNAHFNNIDIGFGLGAEYGKSSTTGIQGWSSRTSMMSGIRFGDVSVGVGSSSFKSGITSQTTGMAYAGVGDFRIRYENDYMWKGSPVGDGGDRYRTTAATISYKDYSLGLNLFTGDPGLQNRKVEGENDKTGFKGTYIEKNQQFRLGAFYAGVGNYRFGVNGEPVRNFFQNHLAHKDGFAFPLFKVLSTVIKPYGTYQTRNSYTSW